MFRLINYGFSSLRVAGNPLKNGFRFENQSITWTFQEFEVQLSLTYRLILMLLPMVSLSKDGNQEISC